MIVKDFDRAGEQALLGSVTFGFSHVGIVGLEVTGAAAVDLGSPEGAEEWREYDMTADYRLSALDGDLDWLAPLTLRARYAFVDMGADGDIEELRLTADYELSFSGGSL